MVDQRFFNRTGPHRLGKIADLVSAEPICDEAGRVMISGVASLESARDGEISLFGDRKLRDRFSVTRAGAVITSRELAKSGASNAYLLIVPSPRLAYLRVCELFHPQPSSNGQIDPTAHIHASACLGDGCRIDAGAKIGAGAEIGANTHVGFGAIVDNGVVVGEQCWIGANSVISHALLGNHVRIASGVSIGTAGFGFTEGRNGLVRVAHLGRVVIGDNVEIGANCTIDRGVSSDTSIGTGTKLDNLVHIAHGVRIGRHCAIAAQVGIAGSTTVGDQVQIGGKVGIGDHLSIGSRVRIAGGSGVTRDIADNAVVGGYPAIAIRDWHRQVINAQKGR